MFTPLKKFLKKRTEEYKFRKEITEAKVLDLWNPVIKEKLSEGISKKTKPLSFKGGLLRVKVSNPTLSQELKLNDQKIIEEINRKIGRKEVKKIIFRV